MEKLSKKEIRERISEGYRKGFESGLQNAHAYSAMSNMMSNSVQVDLIRSDINKYKSHMKEFITEAANDWTKDYNLYLKHNELYTKYAGRYTQRDNLRKKIDPLAGDDATALKYKNFANRNKEYAPKCLDRAQKRYRDFMYHGGLMIGYQAGQQLANQLATHSPHLWRAFTFGAKADQLERLGNRGREKTENVLTDKLSNVTIKDVKIAPDIIKMLDGLLAQEGTIKLLKQAAAPPAAPKMRA